MQFSNRQKKAEIRNKIITSINKLEKFEIKNKSELILKNLISSDVWCDADIIVTYLSIDNEVETAEIIKSAVAGNKKVAVPRITDKELIFFFISDHIRPSFYNSHKYLDPYHKKHFEFNQFNILEPKIHLPVINFENLKNYNILLIVPGVAFTEEKYRLGRGGGYYDRTIKELKTLKVKSFSAVGVFFEEQHVIDLPLDHWDQKLDFIVTDKKMY